MGIFGSKIKHKILSTKQHITTHQRQKKTHTFSIQRMREAKIVGISNLNLSKCTTATISTGCPPPSFSVVEWTCKLMAVNIWFSRIKLKGSISALDRQKTMATFVVKCTSQQLMCSYLAWIACVCAYRKIVCKKMLSFFRAILAMFNQNFYTKIYAQAS